MQYNADKVDGEDFRDQLNNRVDTGAHLKRTHATLASLINPFPLIEVVAFLPLDTIQGLILLAAHQSFPLHYI